MATIGISKPYYAVYSNSGTAITYTGVEVMGKSTSANLSLETSDSNILYADNAPAETAQSFGGGTITLGTDDIYDSAAVVFLGLQTAELSGGGTEYVYDDRQSIPYVGIGFVRKKQINNTIMYQGVVFPKTRAQNPGFDITTQGETIDWQTPEIVFDLLRSDDTNHTWQRNAMFETESAAEDYVKTCLGYTSGG